MNLKSICHWLVVLFGVTQLGSATNEREEYDALLEQARRAPSGMVYTGVDGHKWRGWQGLKTKTGLIIAVDEIVASYRDTDGELDNGRVTFAWWMFKNTNLSEDVVLELIMSNINKHRSDPATLSRNFRVLDSLDYDKKTLQEVVSYFSDTRTFKTVSRRMDMKTFEVSYDARVCDVASGLASRWMRKHNVWGTMDADYNEQTLGMKMEDKKNWYIKRLNEILLKEELVQYVVSPDDPTPRDRMGRKKPGSVDKAVPRRKPSRQTEEDEDGADMTFDWEIIVLVIALLALSVWLYLRCRAS